MPKRALKLWTTLKHNGPAFPAEYKKLPSSLIKLTYDRKPFRDIGKEAEEFAMMYAKLKAEKHKDTKNKNFNANFFEDFRDLLSPSHQIKIKEFKRLSFLPLVKYHQRQTKAKPSREEKLRLKENREKVKNRHGFCLRNGVKEQIGNFYVEPPGIFRGREGNPQHGRIKERVQPEDVIINCSNGATCPPPRGHKWKGRISDPTAAWIAKYTNSLGENKYIQFGQTSTVRRMADEEKYNFAKNLGSKISSIRKKYMKMLGSEHDHNVQLGVAVFFIDKFALRIGNEKGSDEADTVGCSTLRVEHLSLKKTGSVYKIAFDFKGKDSIRFDKEFKVPRNVFNAVANMMRGKRGKENCFDLRAPDINDYLKKLHPNLTAKVFRTYNASLLFQKHLQKKAKRNGNRDIELLKIFQNANLEVAKLCNHKRTLNRSQAKRQERKLQQDIAKRRRNIVELAIKIKTQNLVLKEKRKIKHQNLVNVQENKKYKLDFARKLKDYSLNTSQQNYIDPRITVAWCKKHKLPVEKVWAKTLVKKYEWAGRKTTRHFKF